VCKYSQIELDAFSNLEPVTTGKCLLESNRAFGQGERDASKDVKREPVSR